MSQQFPQGIDLLGTQAFHMLVEVLASDPTPSAPNAGRVWWNSVDKKFKFSDGTSVIDPTARANATGTQTASTISDLATVVKAYHLNEFASPTGSVAMGTQNFSGLATASASGQAVEYAQFQAAIAGVSNGLDFKEHVSLAITDNVTVATPGATIAGRTMLAGDRMLLTGQTTTSQNGIWQWNGSAVALTRPADATGTGAIVQGTVTDASNTGTVAAALGTRTFWMQTAAGTNSDGSIIVGTDAQTWIQPFTAATYTAGNGVTIAANVISASLASGGGLNFSGSQIQVDPAITVRKNPSGAAIPTASTGIYTVSGAVVTINHGLNNVCPSVVVRAGTSPPTINGFATTTGQEIHVDNAPTDASNVSVTLPATPASNNYTITIMG